MGRFGSGFCPTQNQPDQIGWSEFQPVADWYGWSDQADQTFNAGRSIRLELEIWKSAKILHFKGEISVIFSPDFHRIFFEFVKITLGSAKVSPNLVISRQIRWRFHGYSWDLTESEKLRREMLRSQFSQVSSGFGEKTHQLTHRFRVLEAENRYQSSPASGRPVVGSDRTGLGKWIGLRFCWTPLALATTRTTKKPS